MTALGHLAPTSSALVLTPFSPLSWWRTKPPSALLCRGIGGIREALIGTEIHGEPDWHRAILGEAAVAIRIAVKQMKERRITATEIDLALSAVLACALEGEPASAILISSALRRRSKFDHCCRNLSLLWLVAKF